MADITPSRRTECSMEMLTLKEMEASEAEVISATLYLHPVFTKHYTYIHKGYKEFIIPHDD